MAPSVYQEKVMFWQLAGWQLWLFCPVVATWLFKLLRCPAGVETSKYDFLSYFTSWPFPRYEKMSSRHTVEHGQEVCSRPRIILNIDLRADSTASLHWPGGTPNVRFHTSAVGTRPCDSLTGKPYVLKPIRAVGDPIPSRYKSTRRTLYPPLIT